MKLMKAKLSILALIFALAACKSSDPEPSSPIEGTWKIQSVILTDADGQETNFWALYVAFFPCSAEITYTFSNGTYTTFVPNGCVDDDGETLALLSGTGGSYTLTESTIQVDVDGSTLPGNITFSGNTATVTTVDPDDLTSTLTIVFVKV
ncbi:lipocalin family protein [Jiulongibacter sediminis]|jgi:hypothetical protein|uniref:lipocalin family protein n=1 Tax=Jiulongibacter sediminis TaxID=1605367 RepID=UPI0026EC4D8B|nr:lipocalin family protein [Jiulongibacter sediminis]